ncbi:hypothetical protein MMC09_005296 [Bachmanniomyces sp. S44760]|nr:hypothetical protein [Bachmanniomyces sp. S44760]
MSRRHGGSDYYEERDRERDYYGPSKHRGGGSRVGAAEYDEVDVRERRSRREPPEFLREDYGRGSTAGPLVVRETDVREEVRSAPPRRERHLKEHEVEKEEIIIAKGPRSERPRSRERVIERDVREELAYRPRERERERPIEREVEREEIIYQPRERSPPPPVIAREREEYVYRPRERSPPPIAREREEWTFRPRQREMPRERSPTPPSYGRDEQEEIIIRRGESRERPRPRGSDRGRYEDEEIIIRRDERSRERPRPRESSFEREEVIIRRDDHDTRSMRGGPKEVKEDELVIRRSDRDDRDTRSHRGADVRQDELIIRRNERDDRDTRSHRGGDFEKEEIIIRRGERDHSSEPEREPFYEPPPIRAPPIHQEVITHHRHIDHGFENRAPAHAPMPPPSRVRSPSPKSSFEDLEIRRRGEHNGRAYEDDIFIERDKNRLSAHNDRIPRGRSHSHGRSAYNSRDDEDIAEEADYYQRRVSERAYLGEGHNGATKDWAIVDVPPGTKRVQMEGIGGASQDVTWQRYNGVRRSKFNPEDDGPYTGGMELERVPSVGGLDKGRRFVGQKAKEDKMWTEITKDLVIEEAIKESGYDFEETEFFYYVMEYLRYEDVMRLVDLSEEIRRARKARIRDMQFEREEVLERPKKQLALGWDEERIVEREVIYDRPPPPGKRMFR